MYKATKWRRLLLYDGIKVFNRPDFHANIYRNYLLLYCAITILVSKDFVIQSDMVNAAEEYLRAFVKHSIQIYGKEFLSYNVHSLIHLPQECRDHRSLDNFSTFKFETS